MNIPTKSSIVKTLFLVSVCMCMAFTDCDGEDHYCYTDDIWPGGNTVPSANTDGHSYDFTGQFFTTHAGDTTHVGMGIYDDGRNVILDIRVDGDAGAFPVANAIMELINTYWTPHVRQQYTGRGYIRLPYDDVRHKEIDGALRNAFGLRDDLSVE